MKLVQISTISTILVIVLGIAMVAPGFIRTTPPLTAILSFSITDDENTPLWCEQLSNVLKKHNVKAIVFVTGQIADKYPTCITTFSHDVDIGSQTYHYLSLPSIKDYTVELEEVKNGKMAVDRAGNLHSSLFKSPYGETDQNIYSLLNRANISADFSYSTQYNLYQNGKFIKYDLTEYSGIDHSSNFFSSLSTTKPVLIDFDNSTPIDKIDKFVSELKSENIHFVTASELTSVPLTIWESK